ncbi:MAG: hypothetical protein KDD50_02750 [Bdellovibrionales bacterium]|nr:hypothetical protein [Bdellovibrionales bacterium]
MDSHFKPVRHPFDSAHKERVLTVARWQPSVTISTFRLEPKERENLLEELAELFYDVFASSVRKPILTKTTESKPEQKEETLERTGSDG